MQASHGTDGGWDVTASLSGAQQDSKIVVFNKISEFLVAFGTVCSRQPSAAI